MRIPQPIIPVRAPLQPVTVLRSGSADALEVPYIRCLNGRVPEAFEVWDLSEDGVHEFTRTLESNFDPISRKILFKLSSSMRNDSRFLSWVVEH